MLRVWISIFLCFYALSAWAEAGDELPVKQTHVHIEDGVVYCDVQTFKQEAYVLNVLGSGSALTVFWQFEVLQVRPFWLDKTIAEVRLGRQVIPDLVTQRWLMRDLSSGVVHDTRDIHEAMRFVTDLQHVAVVDISILDTRASYRLETSLYLYEGEQADKGWLGNMFDWGVDMGDVTLPIHAAKESQVE